MEDLSEELQHPGVPVMKWVLESVYLQIEPVGVTVEIGKGCECDGTGVFQRVSGDNLKLVGEEAEDFIKALKGKKLLTACRNALLAAGKV